MEITIILFIIGWIWGRRNERKHLEVLAEDERLLGHIIVSSERLYKPQLETNQRSMMVIGSVVIAQDYFKMIIASILNFFGKNLITYESLLERARREAVVRMKKQAYELGHNQIYGVRLEVSTINDTGQMVEAIAYGTSMKTIGNSKVPPDLPTK